MEGSEGFLAWLLRQGLIGRIAVLELDLRKRPSLRRNNGSIVIRVRIDGEDRRISRLVPWDDPVSVVRAEAITTEMPQGDSRKSDLLRVPSC